MARHERPLWVDLRRLAVVGRTAGVGASRSLRRVPATVSFLNPQPALGIFATEQATSRRYIEAVVRLGAAG